MDKLQRLLHWCKAAGSKIPSGYQFRYNAIERYGCFCGENTSEKIQIPTSLSISVMTMYGFMEDIAYEEMLVVFICKLKFTKDPIMVRAGDARKYFEPYIDILPELGEMESVLLWDDVSMIKGTPLEKIRAKFLEDIRQRWDNCDQDWLTFDMYVWADLIIRSRAFADCFGLPCLIPVMDLFNHREDYDVEWSIDMDNCYVEPKHDLTPGQEIFYSYGPKGNDVLMCSYGFAIPDYKMDHVILHIPYTKMPTVIPEGHILPFASHSETELVVPLHPSEIGIFREMCQQLGKDPRALLEQTLAEFPPLPKGDSYDCKMVRNYIVSQTLVLRTCIEKL